MGVVVDIALGAIFLFALIVGLTKGLAKQLSKFLRGLVALAGSIVLTALIIDLIKPTPIFQTIAQFTSGWFKGDTMIIIVNSPEDLSLVLAQHNTLKILSGLSEVLYNDMVTISAIFECNTVGSLLGYYLAVILIGFVLWIILLLLLRLIFKGLIGLINEIIVMPAFKTLDKILGAIWSLAFTYLIMIGIILSGVEVLLIKFLPNAWAGMQNLIKETTILLWMHDTNVIGQLIAGLLNVTIESLHVSA